MFPTRHWVQLTGTLNPGVRSPYVHGLRDGFYPSGSIPDVVLLALNNNNGGSNGNLNVSIDTYAQADSTNVYLSNWNPTTARSFSVVVRSYYSEDDLNT